MTKPRLWEKLHLSQWGRLKALADHLGFKVQRLKGDECQLLMPNVEGNDTYQHRAYRHPHQHRGFVARGRRGKMFARGQEKLER